MIEFINPKNEEPYLLFKELYDEAKNLNQKNIEAIAISSYDSSKKEVESRFVNLKYVNVSDWIFFSNYNSQKATDFKSHNQISGLFFWNKIQVQIRIKANIYKISKELSDNHYGKRTIEKNALAWSSDQSKTIISYDKVVENYGNKIKFKEKLKSRPEHWGGYSFTPYYFEFWKGHKSRLNKRDVYELKNNEWCHSFIQP